MNASANYEMRYSENVILYHTSADKTAAIRRFGDVLRPVPHVEIVPALCGFAWPQRRPAYTLQPAPVRAAISS